MSGKARNRLAGDRWRRERELKVIQRPLDTKLTPEEFEKVLVIVNQKPEDILKKALET